MELKGKVVLVTGASRGIGESICLKMLEKGAVVYGTSREKGGPHPYKMLKLDVEDEASCAQTVNKVIDDQGRIDIFINNAGAGIGGAIEDSDTDEAKWQFEINFFGMLRMLSHILPVMRKQRSGRIILISSVAGFLSVPYQGLYSATKYATEAVAIALRNELRAFGIEVMLVNPGDTKTGFTKSRMYSKGANAQSEYYTSFIESIKKMEEAEENGMNPAIIAWGLAKKLEKKKLSVRYIPGYYKAVFVLSKILPEKFVIFLMRKLYL